MDIHKIREDFQLLKHGSIYFDNAATSLTPNSVVAATNEYYFSYKANIERGAHRLTQKASQAYHEAHHKVAQFVKALPQEIIFCRNATEAINMIASGLPWQAGDTIVTTLLEHHSNYLPWLRLKRQYNVKVEVVRPDAEGNFNLKDFEEAIDPRTVLVALVHVSNVLGSITPVREIAEIAHKKGAWLLVDAAQSAPHLPIDVKELDCDFLAASGHKMLGPTGIGFLYIKNELTELIDPLCLGGGTIADVWLEDYQLTEPWEKFEAGTPNIAGGIGLGAAVDYLHHIGWDWIQKYEQKIIENLTEGLRKRNQVIIYGPRESSPRLGMVSFYVKNKSPHQIATLFDELGNVQVRSGHHCALPLTKYLIHQPRGTVRASLYFYNTEEEVKQFLSILDDIIKMK